MTTFLCSIFYNIRLHDVGTCYKAMRGDIFRGLDLKSNSFNIDMELTAKLSKYRMGEVPIDYYPRYEGKKIKWWHFIEAVWAILRYSLFS